MNKIRKGDSVYIIAGKFKGKIGKILRVLIDKETNKPRWVVIQSINVKKVIKKNPQGVEVIEKEFPIDISNVAYWDENARSYGRVGFKFVNGEKVRFVRNVR